MKIGMRIGMRMRILLLILVILTFLLLLRHYDSPTHKFDIIQLSLSRIEPSFLFEKNPIIINEPIMSPIHLTETLFKYLYVKKTQSFRSDPSTFHQSRCRYALLYPRHADGSIKIVHPRKSKFLIDATEESMKHIQYVEVKLKKRQVIIVPMYWWYQVENAHFGHVELDDSLSYVKRLYKK